MVIEASIAPPNASFVGSHLVAPTIADFGNDGYASLRLLAGNVLLDPVNLVGAGVFPTIDTVPLPQLADLDQDGDLEGAARGALVDLDGDGKPESISAAGNEITVRSADAQKLPLDGWPQLAGTFAWSVDVVVGDVNNDTRLEVYSPSVDGAVYCNRLGLGSANPERIIERGDANWLNRTNAKDPFEPSNTMARAWPLRFPTKEIRAYLTKGDVDYYRLPGVGGLMVQLVSPPAKTTTSSS